MVSAKPFELYSLKGGLWLDEAATQRFHLKGINWFGTGTLPACYSVVSHVSAPLAASWHCKTRTECCQVHRVHV